MNIFNIIKDILRKEKSGVIKLQKKLNKIQFGKTTMLWLENLAERFVNNTDVFCRFSTLLFR